MRRSGRSYSQQPVLSLQQFRRVNQMLGWHFFTPGVINPNRGPGSVTRVIINHDKLIN